MAKSEPQTTAQALILSIFIATLLAVMKLITGMLTHSMAILASALDSLMDVASSTVNFIAAREAAKPPDDDHAYGHEKVESLAGLFQSTLIGVSGLYLIFESLKRLFVGSEITGLQTGMGVMLASMAATYFLVWRLKRIAKENPSVILSAERLHYVTDLVHNFGVILALLLVTWTGWIIWDLCVSVMVSSYIFRGAWKIFKRSVDELMDKSLPSTSIEAMRRLILNFHPSIIGIHNFRSRRVGRKTFLDFHIEIRGEDDFKKAHLMTEALIKTFQKRYPETDITVHYDPEGED